MPTIPSQRDHGCMPVALNLARVEWTTQRVACALLQLRRRLVGESMIGFDENVVEAIFTFHAHLFVALVGMLWGLIGIALGVWQRKELKTASLWLETVAIPQNRRVFEDSACQNGVLQQSLAIAGFAIAGLLSLSAMGLFGKFPCPWWLVALTIGANFLALVAWVSE